jgi:hypothetical protein
LIALQAQAILTRMAQTNSLRVRSVNRGPICYLELSGTVDESFDPNLLLSEAKASKVILNLKQVTRLTSFGVREWTNCMRELCGRVERVFLVQCSPAIVSQLNMVANFAGTAHILSVDAPFYCELCGWETELTCNIEPGKQVVIPEVSCEQCTANMTFDDDPASYFAFPRQASQTELQLDLGVATFLRQMASEGNDPAAHEATSVVGPESVPRPSQKPMHHSQQVPAPQLPGPTPLLSKLRPVLIGLSIPTVVALGIIFAWPSGDSLPTKDKNAFESDLLQGRYDEAYQIVERLEQGRNISQEKSKLLKGEIVAKALSGYGKLVHDFMFEDAASLVQRLVRERVLPADEGTRLSKEVVKAALQRYRDLSALRQFADAEAIAKPLETKSVLQPIVRAGFSNEVGRERERIVQMLRREVLSSVEKEQYEAALAAAKDLAVFGPYDSDVTIAVAKAQSGVKDKDKESAKDKDKGSLKDRDKEKERLTANDKERDRHAK